MCPLALNVEVDIVHTMLSESIQEVRSCSNFLVPVDIMDLGTTHGCSANRNSGNLTCFHMIYISTWLSIEKVFSFVSFTVIIWPTPCTPLQFVENVLYTESFVPPETHKAGNAAVELSLKARCTT
jgi:hypothetical protein